MLSDTSLKEFDKPIENHLAIEEIDGYIDYETKSHAKPSLKTVLNKFKQAPYGFIDLDIEWLIATLFRQKRMYLEKNSELITLKTYKNQEILNLLTQRHEHEKILIDRKEKIGDIPIKILKEVLNDYFGVSNSIEDDDSLMQMFQEKSQDEVVEIDLLLKEYYVESRYPGKDALIESKELLQEVNNITSIREFFTFRL